MMTDLENDSTLKIGLAEKNCLEKFWEFFFENIAKKFPFVILFIKTEESKNLLTSPWLRWFLFSLFMLLPKNRP